MLKTRITEKFGLKYPIMSAPMSLHSGGQLAGAVTQAGGLGLFGATNPAGGAWLRNQIELARAKSDGRPFGLGFITHLIPAFPDLFEVAIDERVPVIAFSFSDPSQWVSRAKDAGATVICQIQSIESAAEAANAGADILVVQGNEAGGHTGTSNLMPLLVRVLRDYPDLPVLAAGGYLELAETRPGRIPNVTPTKFRPCTISYRVRVQRGQISCRFPYAFATHCPF